MQLKSVAYTSLAALDMDEKQLLEIHGAARDFNVLDKVTGLLIFNGTHFLQWIEGPTPAVDELVERLRRDPRHSGFEVRDERFADQRLFGSWSMELVRVRSRYLQAQEDIARALPGNLPEHVRERIMGMAELMSVDVEI